MRNYHDEFFMVIYLPFFSFIVLKCVYSIFLQTWHELLTADQFDPENQQQLPGAFYEDDEQFLHSQDVHLREVYEALKAQYLSSC